MKKLSKIVVKGSKRVGRGYGSGKGGHTSGRGNKGQKARGDVPIIFEGTKIKKSFIKRLPFSRGRGKFKSWAEKLKVINLARFEAWPKGVPVNNKTLTESGDIQSGESVKILGVGTVKTALKVEGLKISKSAREKIIAAGGQIS